MGFIILLFLTTLSIAGSAAFFSIYGLAQIFTGAFMPVVIMASSLEVGKLVAASYVYRFWSRISFFLKTYLILAILVLMLITSLGILGFLSAAYQQDILPLEEIKTKIALLESKEQSLDEIKRESLVRRQELNDQVASQVAALPPNYASKKQQVRDDFAPKIAKVEQEIVLYTTQLRAILEEKQQLKFSTLQQELKTGPIVFIAEVFGQQVDNATKWLIIIIIFAFDPLAVALTIGTNIAIVERREHKRRRKDEPAHVLMEEKNPIIIPSIEEKPIIEEEKPVIIPIIEEKTFTEENRQEVTTEQIRQAIEELEHQKELRPAELAQKAMLEEMLRKREVTERVRNPKK